MDGQQAVIGPGISSSHRSSSGPAYQASSPSTLRFIPSDATSPTINQLSPQVLRGAPPYLSQQYQGPTPFEQRAPQRAESFGHHPLPATQSASPSDSRSQQPVQISAQIPYRPAQPPPPMNLRPEPGIQGAAAGSIPPQHGRDHHNPSSSQTNVSNAMPLQVSGLNFQYDLNAPFRSQNFAPRLPLSHPISHAPSAPQSAHQLARQSSDYGAGSYTQSNIFQPSSRQHPIDLTQSIPPQSTTGPSTSQSAAHQGQHYRQSSLCSPFCQPGCTAPHGIGPPSQQSHAPPSRPLQQGVPVPPPAPPSHFNRPPPQPSRGSFNGYQPSGSHLATPPAQQLPPAPQRQPVAPQQLPPAERPPAPEQQPTQQIRPSSQQRYVSQQYPPSHPVPNLAQPNGPHVVPHGNTQPSPRTVHPSGQQAAPPIVSRGNSSSVAAPSPSVVRGPITGDNFQQAQKAVLNEAMVAALTPLQSGVEQLWSLAVEQFHSVLEKVTMAYTMQLQAESDKAIGAIERLKQMESDNVKLQQDRCRLGERITSLEKEVEDLKEALRSRRDELTASQNEAGLLAGEKARLEVELSSLQSVGRKIADSGVAPPNQLVSILLQQELAQQIEKKLRDAHQEVVEQLTARKKAERQLQGMKEKLKALLGYDIAEIDKRTSVSPSRETSTVVGTPPPKQSHHSRRHSNDMSVSSPLVSPVPQSSHPPSSVPTSPVVLRAVPPIERRPSPKPQLPTPPTTAATLKPSDTGQGVPEGTEGSSSVPPRLMNVRSSTAPAVGDAGSIVGLKRARSAAGQDPGEPLPVRRLTVDSEGPRREGLQSRSASRGPHVPAPPIASISSDGTVNNGQSMDVNPPQQSIVTSPPPAVRPPPPVVEDTKVKPDPDKEEGEEEDETVEVKLEDQLDQLMDELVSYDDNLEEGEVTDADSEGQSVDPVSEKIKQPSPPPAPLEFATTEQTRPSSPAPKASHYREPTAEQGPSSTLKASVPPPPQSTPVPPSSANSTSSPGVPPSRSWATSSYVPPARSWAQAYPGRPLQSSSSTTSITGEQSTKPPPGTPKLSVLKHWDLLYSDDGTQWKCRLCQSMPNPGKPRAAFNKKTETHEAMLQHSQTEHPVACADMAKLAPAELAELKARLR